MSEENAEEKQQNPHIIIEFDGVNSSVCRVIPVEVSLSQIELAAFRLNAIATRALNDRMTAEFQQEMQKQMQLESIMKSGILKTQ